MKANGNGNPEVCVHNLLKTVRGEVPYERIKGIDRALIDKPAATAGDDILADVEYVIETYEPRAELDSAELEELAASVGGFELDVDIYV